MKKDSLKISTIGILCMICFLQGCETMKGFTGTDKGINKISQGVGQDLNNTWDNLMDVDAYLREKLW